jgi:hypothetical protein
MRYIAHIVAIVVAAASARVAAHDESLGARFVQLAGVDAGDCLDHDSPCLSVTYALADPLLLALLVAARLGGRALQRRPSIGR